MVADPENVMPIWNGSCNRISNWKKKSSGNTACLQKRPAMPPCAFRQSQCDPRANSRGLELGQAGESSPRSKNRLAAAVPQS